MTWKKGESGNPKGRPRTGLALSARIREEVDPSEMIKVALAIMRGQGIRVQSTDASGKPIEGGGVIAIEMPSPKDQLTALKWLSEHGWIKPPAQLVIDDNRSEEPTALLDPSKLSDEQLDTMEGLYETMSTKKVIDV